MRFLKVLCLKLEARLTKKSIIWSVAGKLAEIAKTVKNLQVFFQLLGLSAFQLRGRICKKSSPERSKKIKHKNDHNVDPILNRFLNKFGSILGEFWPPSWRQIDTKRHPNPTAKPSRKSIPLWKASGSILNGFWLSSWLQPKGANLSIFK